MPTTSGVQMFCISSFTDMDTNESDTDSENPCVVLGTHSSLAILQVSEVDVNDDGVIHDDEMGTADYLSYDTGGGAISVALDSSSL